MHGLEAQEPTFVDTFRVLNYMFTRESRLPEAVKIKHMQNLESAFGPETVEEAMHLYHLDLAAERGTLSYTEEGVAYDANDEEGTTS